MADISSYNLCLTLLSLLKKNIKKKEKKEKDGLRFIVLIVVITVVVLGIYLDAVLGTLVVVSGLLCFLVW